jgi:hypothetical protein
LIPSLASTEDDKMLIFVNVSLSRILKSLEELNVFLMQQHFRSRN